MGIWNTGASPIGYAYQSAQGSGINIKPIDPRAFQVDNGSTQRSGRSGGSDSEPKYEAQYGTRQSLEQFDRYFESQKSVLQRTFTDKILSETNKDKVLKLQQDYISEMNNLSQQQMNLSVAKQNAEFAHSDQVKTTDILRSKELLGEIGLEESLDNVNTGSELLSKFIQNGSPISYDVKTGKLMTNELRQQTVNRESRAYIDDSGKINITDYKSPVLNMSNSKQANDEVYTIIKGTDGNYTRNYNEFVQGGEIQHDYTDNQQSLNASVDNIWNKVSGDTKNFAYSSVLEMGINYHTGVKKPLVIDGKEQKDKKGKVIMTDLQYLSGDDAVAEITTLINKARKLKKGDPEQQKLIDKAERISDGIVGTAKNYLIAMANNDTVGLRKLVDNTKLNKDKSGANGDGSTGGQDKTSPLNALYAKAVNVPGETTLKVTNYNGTGYEDIVYPQKRIAMNIQDKTFITNTMFGVTPSEIDKSPINANMLSKVIIGNIPFNFKSIVNGKNGSDSKIIGVSDEIKYFPATADIPSVNDKNFFGTTAKDENGNYILQGYIGVTVEVDEETTIPIPTEGAQGGYKMIRAGDVGNNPSKYPSLNATFIDNWGWNDKVRYTVYTPAPDAFAATTNTASEGSQAQYDFNYSNSRQVENGYTKTLNEEILNRNNDARTYMMNNPMKDRSGNVVEPTNDNIIQIDNTIIIGQDGKNKFNDAIAKKKLVFPTSEYEYFQNMERIKTIPSEAITEKSRAELQEENDAAFKKEQTKGTIPYKNSYVPY